ncbi:MAG TPA: VOC family protein [Acidobacteriaceae bacterium]|jgi:PhnB protein|nr:VOC family protein [Acidobacteriaceae bacterium]
MKMSVHLNFGGNCKEAFAFYQKVFGTAAPFSMTYSQAPHGMPVAPDWGDKVMHTSIPLGGGLLMGCDAPPDRSKPLGGFQVSVEPSDEKEVTRIFEALSHGGSVQMPLTKTFWSPLFGMCTDRFGVGWMVGVPGEPMN